MKQILHIFRKDTKHLWIEITVLVFVLLLTVTHYSVRWDPVGDRFRTQQIAIIVNFLLLAVPLTWCVMVARLTHAESLVGENQFWLTRPYRWYSLLAAKALFVVVWIGLPTFLAEYALLGEAGLHPHEHVGDLLLETLLILMTFVLLMGAVSTVTSNMSRLVITVLGGGLVVFVWGLTGFLHSRSVVVQPQSWTWHYYLIMILFAAAMVLLQYSTRRVWIARVLLVTMFLTLASSQFMLERGANSRLDRVYAATAATPMQIVYQSPDPMAGKFAMYDNNVEVDVPIAISGMPDDSAVSLENVRYTIEGPGGRYSSPWRAQAQYPPVSAADHKARVELMLPREEWERLRSAPVHIHLALGLMRLSPAGSTTVSVTSPDFDVPGIGVCSTRSTYRQNGLFCRTAVRDMSLTRISTNWSSQPCSPSSSTKPRTTWFGYLNPSVSIDSVQLQQWWANRDWALCPGTPVTFTKYAAAGRSQAELDVSDFRLPDDTTR